MSSKPTPSSPAQWAINRVPRKQRLAPPKVCPACSSVVRIAHHNEVYGRSYGEWPWMYACVNRECGAQVGMHPFTNLPLGTLANETLRRARMAAKNAFNPMWESEARRQKTPAKRGRVRQRAYERLAKAMKIDVSKCHFGYFDLDQCAMAMKVISQGKV